MNCVTQSALPIALHFWQFSATWSVATPGSRTEIAGGGLGRGEGAVDTGTEETTSTGRKSSTSSDCHHTLLPPPSLGEW